MKPSCLMPLCLTMLAVAAPGLAQQSRDDGGSARLQVMVQQLTGEKTQLQADNKKLKTDLDAANAELKKLRDDKASLERRASQSEASLNQVNASNTRNEATAAQLRSRLDEIIAEYRKTAETLRVTELDRNDVKGKLDARERAFGQCVASNQKLFETGNDVLDKFEDRGRWAALRTREPFTQNKRVELQNLVDQYRWALEDQKLPGAPAPDAAKPASAGSNGT
jgi:chromosome segregation ATPase